MANFVALTLPADDIGPVAFSDGPHCTEVNQIPLTMLSLD
jgi:hypothetical protein